MLEPYRASAHPRSGRSPVVIASQLPRVRDSIDQIAAVVPVYVAFLVVMPLLG